MAAVTVTLAKPVKPPVERVVLELTPNEAEVLSAVVGGLPLGGYESRAAIHAVHRAFSDAGYGAAGQRINQRRRLAIQSEVI